MRHSVRPSETRGFPEGTRLFNMIGHLREVRGLMRYRIVYCAGNEWIRIAIDKQLTIQRDEYFYFGETDPLSDSPPPPFINELFGIHGVEAVGLERYTLLIKRGEVFQWNEIVPAVLAALKVEVADNESLIKAPAAEKPPDLTIGKKFIEFFRGKKKKREEERKAKEAKEKQEKEKPKDPDNAE